MAVRRKAAAAFLEFGKCDLKRRVIAAGCWNRPNVTLRLNGIEEDVLTVMRPVVRPNSSRFRQHLVWRSTFLPRACSGLIYAAVPRITPPMVSPAVSVGELEKLESAGAVKILARPK